MSEETNTIVLSVEETEKGFAIANKVNDFESLFLDKNNFIPVIDFVKDKVTNLVADVHEKDGIAIRKSLNRKIAGLKNAIEDAGKNVAAELKAKPKMVDATRKAVKDTLQALQDEVMMPVVAIEKRKEEIVEITNLPATAIGNDSNGIKFVIEQVKAHEHDLDYWDESYEDAQTEIREALRQLNDMLASAEKAEADAIELEALRAKQAEFERAEREKAEAKQRELESQLEAERKAKEEAERAAIKAQAEAEKAKAEANIDFEAKAEKDAQRTADNVLFVDDAKAIRDASLREAVADIEELFVDTETAQRIVKAIFKGQVRHIYFK